MKRSSTFSTSVSKRLKKRFDTSVSYDRPSNAVPVRILSLLLTLSVTLATCANHRALPEEKAILPEAGVEKYWLFNQVVPEGDGYFHYDCMLLVQSPTAQGDATSFFASEWNSYDSSYYYGMQVDPKGNWSRPGRWPMIARLDGDSTATHWRLFWDRKSLWFDGEYRSPKKYPLASHGALVPQKPWDAYRLLPVESDTARPTYGIQPLAPKVFVFPPFAGSWRNGDAGSFGAATQGGVFCDASTLIQAANAKAVYWVQLIDSVGNQTTHLLQLGNDGRMSVLAEALCSIEGKREVIQRNFGHFVCGGGWESPHSRKTYLLELEFNGANDPLLIRPKIQDQELQAGKKSFWMGAVEARRAAEEQPYASGNMYIFTH